MIFKSVKRNFNRSKNILLLISLIGLLHSSYAQTRQQLTPLKSGDKVLWIGNSYSGFFGPTYDALNALLQASNPAIQNVTFANKGKGMGIVLEYATWQSLGVIDEIRKGGWTYVVIQTWEDAFYRWGAGTLENGDKNLEDHYGRDEASRIKARDVLLANTKILDAEIKKVGAKTIMFEPHPSTWDYEYVYKTSQKTYSEILPSLNVVYAPVLWSWEKVRIDNPPTRYECSGSNSDGFIKMLYSDCGHQNWNGTALDAYTFYTMFTGKSAVGLNPSNQVFTKMDADKNYLATIGNTVGLQIIALNNSGDTEAPTVPVNLQTSNITSSSFALTWNASTDNNAVVSYEVFEGSNLKGKSATTSIVVTGLKASTSYNITVKATDAAGNSSVASAVKNVTTLISSDKEAPTVPTALVASAVTINSFTLSWTASTDNEVVTAYEIFKNGVNIGTSETTSFKVTGLNASTSYEMTVKAKDAASNTSAASAVLEVATLAPDVQAPSIPSGLNATGLSSTTFTLNWSASTDNTAVVRYEVYMNGELYGNTTSNETNMPVPFLDPSTSYTMSVKAKDAAGNTSAASADLVVTTNVAPVFTLYEAEDAARVGGSICTDHSGFSGTGFWCYVSGENNSITFTINAAAGNFAVTCRYANGYGNPRTLSLYVNGVKQKQVSFLNSNNWSNFVDHVDNVKLNAGSNTIMYKFDAGDNGQINIDYIKVESAITAVREAENQLANMSIYPNPASNNIQLDFGHNISFATISVFDLQGRILSTKFVNNTSNDDIDISSLSKGVYTLKVTNANQTSNLKFVKQ